MIDYKNPAEVSTMRSICVGALTANIGAIISLTLIDERPPELEWALICFATSLPLLVACATAFDRVLAHVRSEGSISNGVKGCITAGTVFALTTTYLGYVLFMWHFSEKAFWAYILSTVAGLALLSGVLKGTKSK